VVEAYAQSAFNWKGWVQNENTQDRQNTKQKCRRLKELVGVVKELACDVDSPCSLICK
jgi:hypothetical protein